MKVWKVGEKIEMRYNEIFLKISEKNLSKDPIDDKSFFQKKGGGRWLGGCAN